MHLFLIFHQTMHCIVAKQCTALLPVENGKAARVTSELVFLFTYNNNNNNNKVDGYTMNRLFKFMTKEVCTTKGTMYKDRSSRGAPWSDLIYCTLLCMW